MKPQFKTLAIFLKLIMVIFVIGIGSIHAKKVVETRLDMRILVDVSKGMGTTDPNNIRAEAVKLILNLIPNDTRVGVWTYGQYYHPLIKHHRLEEGSREHLFAKADLIHALGQTTDLYKGLSGIVKDYPKSYRNYHKKMIIITDGTFKDNKPLLTKEIMNKKINRVLMSSIKEENYQIFPIGIGSGTNDELLYSLALSTKGHYQKIESVNQLLESVFQAYLLLAKPLQLPIQNNTFMVDDKVKHFRMLFVHGGSQKMNITLPNGTILNPKELEPTMRYVTGDYFDVLTVSKPVLGKWAVSGIDMSKVAVLDESKLNFKIEDFPMDVYVTESFTYKIKGPKVGKNSTAKPLNITTVLRDPNGLRRQLTLSRKKTKDVTASHTTYANDFTFQTSGLYNMTTTVRDGDVIRKREQIFTVHPYPFKAYEVEKKNEKFYEIDAHSQAVIIAMTSNLINKKSVKITAMVYFPDEEKEIIDAQYQSNTDKWWFLLDGMPKTMDYEYKLKIEAQTLAGRELRFIIPPETIINIDRVKYEKAQELKAERARLEALNPKNEQVVNEGANFMTEMRMKFLTGLVTFLLLSVIAYLALMFFNKNINKRYKRLEESFA